MVIKNPDTNCFPFATISIVLFLSCSVLWTNTGCDNQQNTMRHVELLSDQDQKRNSRGTIPPDLAQKQELSGTELVDLIPWKPLTIDNFQKSSESDRWVLIDGEQLAIFQVQRGEKDYRRSVKIKEHLTKNDFDCYYFLWKKNDQSDRPRVLRLLNSLLEDIKFDDDNKAFGYIVNFRTKKLFPIIKGTETEVLQILEGIKKK